MKNLLLLAVVVLFGYFGYQYFKPSPTALIDTANVASSTDSSTTNISTIESGSIVFTDDELANIPATYSDSMPVTKTANVSNFTCDGRQHCSQMTSCSEATYFVQHCPNTKMDGNNDGVPCEQQWCQ